MARFFSWLLALACLAGVIVATGFYRPEYLPRPLYEALLKQGLAAPMPVQAGAATSGAPAPGRQGAAAPGGGGQQRPTAVEAQKVRIGTVSSTLTAVGTLRADETITVSAEIDGRISEVVVQEGTKVKAGDVLFRLDDSMLKATLAQARAELALAEANYERADTLFRQKSGTERTRDESRYTLDRTRANVDLVSSQLDKATVRASFDGVVGLRSIGLGEYVNKGEQLIVLNKVDPVKVDFRLPEVELANVKVGSKVKIEMDALPGRFYEGEVYAIDPQVDINGRSLQLRAKVANTSGDLKPGLFARVEITTASRPNAIIIPESAVVSQGRDRFAYVVKDNKATRVKLVTGIRQPGSVEVIQGIGRDDTVVVTGQQRLRDGLAVEVVGTGPTS
ncbi:efflux RND transporter periplasmic adaptor subunit [Prosthecomicrobium sp. N25]|uniref:efflux RND transporter periplasmic adaptor subunit n=1 Tax=Prosthecomicrobium sp. N25 TaxID=3129254 RepID=UPI0030784040